MAVSSHSGMYMTPYCAQCGEANWVILRGQGPDRVRCDTCKIEVDYYDKDAVFYAERKTAEQVQFVARARKRREAMAKKMKKLNRRKTIWKENDDAERTNEATEATDAGGT
jgi:hypothetical protein